MKWPPFTPKEQRMPDTPQADMVDLGLVDPETTADLSHAADRPDPSHLAEFVDVHLPAADVPAEPDPPAAHAEHCPACGQDVPPMRALIDDTLDRIAERSAVVLTAARRKAVADRPALAMMFRADSADLDAEFLTVAGAFARHLDPGSAESMTLLDAELDEIHSPCSAGRPSLPDPDWPGGRRPPSLLDHAVLNHHMVTALRAFQGDSWTPLHTRAWHTALTYAAARTCAAQILGGAR